MIGIEQMDDHCFNIHYEENDEEYLLATVEAAPNGFSYLRDLYEVPGFNQADYELVLEDAEADETFQNHLDGDGSYDLASGVDRFFSSDEYELAAGKPYKPPVKTEM